MQARSSNPFKPTFGCMPFALAGRDELIDDVIFGLANQPGDPNRSTIFVGPRGSGKTVLLKAIADSAEAQGWINAKITTCDGLIDKLLNLLRANAAGYLTPIKQSNIVSAQAGPIGFTREVLTQPQPWCLQLKDMVEQLNEKGIGVLIVIDEVDPENAELEALVSTYQELIGDDMDIALIMAGLPSQVTQLLMSQHVSFIRRAFQRWVTSISPTDVEAAILETVEANGKSITSEALDIATEATQGFAFAIQLIGYYLWRESADADVVDADCAKRAIERSKRELKHSVIEPILRELRPREIEYLQAMAQDANQSSTSDIAKRMGIGMTYASNLRRRLIDHGVISEVRMGTVRFEMPFLADYLRR